MIAGLFVLLFFSPLAFIYGRWRARGLKMRHETLKGRLAALLPMPLILATCAAVAIVWQNEASGRRRADLLGTTMTESALDTGNGFLDALLVLARWLGQLELILFMVALPYLLGAAIAALLLWLDASGRIVLPPPDLEPDAPDGGDGSSDGD